MFWACSSLTMLGREGKERGEQLTFLAEPQPHRLSGGRGVAPV